VGSNRAGDQLRRVGRLLRSRASPRSRRSRLPTRPQAIKMVSSASACRA
jgi:hypothetical protein